MTANENNRRYLAEAWIDEDKDEEFKKSFLENLLNQLEHHKADGSGFDADMLDGKHYCEISKEIDEKVKGFLNDFSIGKVHISNENGNEYVLGFDAITLYAPVDGYSSEEKTLPWDDSPKETSKTLLEVFEELYNLLKDNEDDIEERVSTLEELEEDLNDKISSVITDNGDETYSFNATTINGIQIYILSETAYAARPQSEKNDIRNVFIVKPDNEVYSILDENGQPKYGDGIVTDNTNIAEISRYYEFRVAEIETDDGTERWLQYRHEGTQEDWNNMAKTSDFLDNSLIQSNIITYLSSGDYNLSPRAVKSAFDQIDSFNKLDTNSLPTQFLLRNFLSGVKYTPDSQEEDPIVHTLPNQGNSQYLDLDLLIDKIEGIIDTKVGAYWETVYPVGSIYMSLENTSPEVLFGGGTWERIQGRFLLAATEGENSTYYAGKQDGAATVQLTTAQLPSHNHQHVHKHGKMDGISYLASNDDVKVNIDTERAWVEKKKGGIHYIYAKIGEGQKKLTGIATKPTTGDATSTSTTSTGSNNPHNNMPPYLAVNVWRRTA